MNYPIVARMLAVVSMLAFPTARAASFNTLYAFPNPTPAPYYPAGSLVQSGSVFYGTTAQGGAAGRGTVFRFDPASGNTTLVYSFSGKDGASPQAGLLALGGKLYGTTFKGGAAGLGAVFALDPAHGQETVLYSFSGPDGQNPQSAPVFAGGAIYGTTSAGGASGGGAIFKIVLSSGAETTAYSFAGGNDGAAPFAGMIADRGLLYGTTSLGGANQGGAIYAFNPATSSEAVVYSFAGGNDSGNPEAPLVNVAGTLYGTTAGNGGIIAGTVFKFVPTGDAETVIYTFYNTNPANGFSLYSAVVSSGGLLFGTAAYGGTYGYGVLFQVDPTSGTEKVIASFDGVDGSNPQAGMISANGLLYGTTSGASVYASGPNAGLPAALPGTIFSLDPSSSAVNLLASFKGINPFYNGLSALLDLNGLLYGSTAQGGPAGNSAVFTVDASTGAETQLADLGANNLAPGALVKGTNVLYGTTYRGGVNNNGMVYSLNPSSGALKTIYSFVFNDGAYPVSPLLKLGGFLYGSDERGGAERGGTIFKINPLTEARTTLYSFSFGSDGGFPSGGLIDVGGLLYGTTQYGGTDQGFGGVVFSVDPKAGTETVLYSFQGGSQGSTDGAYPRAGVVKLGGALYGTTTGGGGNQVGCGGSGCGTVFSVDLKSGAEKIQHSFTGGLDGGVPFGALLPLKGKLYGTASSGGQLGNGTLFSIDPKTGAETVLYSFMGLADGATPAATLISNAGILFGTTSSGGPGNAGTVFSFTP